MTNLLKPGFGKTCNSCGYCCTMQPCRLAQEFLLCQVGPCVALEAQGNKFICGLVRNPLGYLFKAKHPESEESALDAPPECEIGYQLSVSLAHSLGFGLGCDATDDKESASWGEKSE